VRIWYTNDELADVLERVSELLTVQHPKRGSPEAYRAASFGRAAQSLRSLDRSVISILDAEGLPGVERVVAIGKTIAASLRELIETGKLRYLERLEGAVAPEDLFATIPGIGDALASRIHDMLGVETLEELEVAARDGRLESLPGVGTRRAHAIRDLVGHVLSQSTRRRARRIREELGISPRSDTERPSVAALLAVDGEYLIDVEADVLPTIIPRRFNPDGAARLPVLHTDRDGWHFTAMFSNTARAHRLHTTHDWVMIFYEKDGHEDQCTVVTETHGHLAGHRVVRGRESECRTYYAERPSTEAPGVVLDSSLAPPSRPSTEAPGEVLEGPRAPSSWLPGVDPDGRRSVNPPGDA
jgi:hypothetical protein